MISPGLDAAPAPLALITPRRRALEEVAEELRSLDTWVRFYFIVKNHIRFNISE